MNHLVHCSKCRSFPCNCWQNQWGPDPSEAYREGFSRGFEAAKAAAIAACMKESERWDGENADRYWQCNRIAATIGELQPEAHNG